MTETYAKSPQLTRAPISSPCARQAHKIANATEEILRVSCHFELYDALAHRILQWEQFPIDASEIDLIGANLLSLDLGNIDFFGAKTTKMQINSRTILRDSVFTEGSASEIISYAFSTLEDRAFVANIFGEADNPEIDLARMPLRDFQALYGFRIIPHS